ncbi:Peptidyl-prolyl cis-trans isomerase ppiC [Cronobacter sakazakii 696]|nr:Peptidyl-prolyl cis-trans isomerase ppiC [Cronobacter sakazakii 696]
MAQAMETAIAITSEFRQGQMVPAFDKVVFSCPVLEPTGPLHTQFGYHIIKVLYRN